MSSKRQKLKGYPTELEPVTEATQSFCIIIPEGEAYRNAAYVQLLQLGKWWSWQRDDSGELATLSALTWRSLFQFNEDCGGEDVATKEDIRDGIYEAANRIALQIATGQYANIGLSTDADGVVTPTPDDPLTGVELPEDDPTTPAIDESLAASYGGSFAIMKALEQMYDKLDAAYGNVNGTPIVPEAQSQFNMKNLFDCDPIAMDAAVTGYYSYRATNNQLVFTPTAANIQYFFCHGSDERAWTQWLSDVSGFAYAKVVQLATLSSALSDLFWSGYYAKGTLIPSSDYLDASCVKSPTEIMYVTTLGVAAISQTQWKGNHRIRITTEGYFTDIDGDTLDTWWYVDPPAVPVNRLSSVNAQIGANTIDPSLNVVPYNAAHKYVWTMDNAAGSADFRLTIGSAGMNTPTSPTSGIKVTIEDLGEVNLL